MVRHDTRARTVPGGRSTGTARVVLVAAALVLATLAVVPAPLGAQAVGPDTAGSVAAGAALDSVAGEGAYHPLGPVRVLDSRAPALGLTGTWGPGIVRDLPIAGEVGVPVEAVAVAMNVTVTGGTAASDLRLWPAGTPLPGVSNLNWEAGETAPAMVVVGLGDDGAVSIRNQSGQVHVIADVVGWYGPDADPTGTLLTTVGPERVLDTRAGIGLDGAFSAGEERYLRIPQLDAPRPTAAVLNVTVTGGTEASDLRLWAHGQRMPGTSNLNWVAGQTRANLAVVPLPQPFTGYASIMLRNQSGQVHVIADLVGYYSSSGDVLMPVDPVRIQDSRKPDVGLAGTWGTGQTRDVPVPVDQRDGSPDAPPGATGVVANVTVTGGTAASDLRVWPAGAPVPGTSNLNWPAGATVPNLVMVPLGDDGAISVRNQSGDVHVIVDIVGYLVPRAGAASPLTGIAALGNGCVLMVDGTVQCWGNNEHGAVGTGTYTDRLSPVPVPGVSDAVQVRKGSSHSCAVIDDGTVLCWGSNEFGELGDGTTADRLAPVAVAGVDDATDVVVGWGHTCVLRDDDTVSCWGDNARGQLGDGTTTDRTVPTPVPGLAGVEQLVAGGEHTCARLDDGTARCWGRNDFGELGIGDTGVRSSPTPVAVVGLTDLVDLDVGCALDGSGTVWCWGIVVGDLGDWITPPVEVDVPGTVTDVSNVCAVSDGALWCWRGSRGVVPFVAEEVPGVVDAVAVHGGCVLRADTTARCTTGDGTVPRHWLDWLWQPLLDLPTDAVAPVQPPAPTVAELGNGSVELEIQPTTSPDVAGYDLHRSTDPGLLGDRLNTAPITDLEVVDRDVDNDTTYHYRVVARDYDDNTSTPSASTAATPSAPPLEDVTSIAAGSEHTCAARVDGTVWCWGENRDRQIGDGSTVDADNPTTALGLTGAVEVGAGEGFSCARRVDGTVWCWGRATDHRTGNRSKIDPGIPKATRVTGAAQLSIGAAHGCVVLDDETARCWGDNEHGQVGDGGTDDQINAQQVTGLTDVLEVSAGRDHSCALLTGGTVWCWGANAEGQLGDGGTDSSTTPVQVAGLTGAVEIDAGGGRSCARLGDGTVTCWGATVVGDGTTQAVLVPTPVPALAGAGQVGIGRWPACAVVGAGAVGCWGREDRGELGDGGGTDSVTLSPVGAVGITDAAEVTVGWSHVCARLLDGTARCWGQLGRLGTGLPGDSDVPLAVVLPTPQP